jgi:PhzF family phenazine biosynthesis protein
MKTFFVDSFTDQKFKGNPAAVCLTETELSNSTMQSIATEIGFSETAFIKKMDSNTYSIRFFTLKKKYHYADMQHWLPQKLFLILQRLMPLLL